MSSVSVYDPTVDDKLSRVRGVGRYIQILRENFPEWNFGNKVKVDGSDIFINPFFNFISSPLISRRVAKKQVAVIHDLIPLKYGSHFPAGIKGNLNIFLNKLSLKNYDLIITDSEESKKDIIDILRLKDSLIKVIYPCLPKSFNGKYKSPETVENNEKYDIPDSKYCIYVGDATWNKNLLALAKALKIINVTCVFVGKVFEQGNRQHIKNAKTVNKWQEEFRLFLKESDGDKRFIFTGYMPDNRLFNLYKQSTLNILVSRDEGFGFSWLEAAHFSVPSVLSDIPVLKEISGGAAQFCDPLNPEDIADKIGELYFRKDMRNQVGRRAYARSGFFSPVKFREDLLTALT